jgi:hypothetical protein
MTDGIEHRIECRPGYRLLVTWSGGARSVADFSEDARQGGVWAELRDELLFDQARIAHDGSVLEWPEPARSNGEPRVDVDADGLWAMVRQQAADVELALDGARR